MLQGRAGVEPGPAASPLQGGTSAPSPGKLSHVCGKNSALPGDRQAAGQWVWDTGWGGLGARVLGATLSPECVGRRG